MTELQLDVALVLPGVASVGTGRHVIVAGPGETHVHKSWGPRITHGLSNRFGPSFPLEMNTWKELQL